MAEISGTFAGTPEIHKTVTVRRPDRNPGLEGLQREHALVVGGDAHVDSAEQRIAGHGVAELVGGLGEPISL
ncbi:MAG: hypothetical protein OXQ94_04240 [Gemmatimonadota bacterium]|nr:hypothetical protein [Gemmatimonadota bacterium]MDE2870883.1 hypothetical protein [Gemmatimonadota bacterium]